MLICSSTVDLDLLGDRVKVPAIAAAGTELAQLTRRSCAFSLPRPHSLHLFLSAAAISPFFSQARVLYFRLDAPKNLPLLDQLQHPACKPIITITPTHSTVIASVACRFVDTFLFSYLVTKRNILRIHLHKQCLNFAKSAEYVTSPLLFHSVSIFH